MTRDIDGLCTALHELRLLRKLSVAELAKRSGLSTTCLRGIERGKLDGRRFADALAKGLGCDAEHLRRGDGVEAFCAVLAEVSSPAQR